MDISLGQYVLTMGAYIAFLLLLIVVMRKYHKFAHFFWFATLLTIPLWFINLDGWFRWVKTFSVLIPIIVLGYARIANHENKEGNLWDVFRKKWVVYFFYGVLFLNILEASLKDLALGYYANAICGIILCVTIPLPPKFWKIAKGKTCDVVGFTSIAWNLLYTLWNACFVFGESPAYFASSVCILLAAELYPLIKKRPELYATARIYTLGTHLIIRACFPNLFLNLMNSSSWYSELALYNWGYANVAFGFVYLTWFIYKMKKGTYIVAEEI